MHKTVWNSTALAPVPQHEIPDTCNTPLAPCTPILSSPLPSQSQTPPHLAPGLPTPSHWHVTLDTWHVSDCTAGGQLCCAQWAITQNSVPIIEAIISLNPYNIGYIHVDQKVSSSKTQYTYKLQIHVSYEIGVTHQHEISCKLKTHKALFSQHVHVEKLKSLSVELVAQKVASQED